MSLLRWLGVASLLAAGCMLFEAKEATYLRGAQDRATQEEVKARLGPPAAIKADPAGESSWVYQIRQEQSGSRMTAPGMWCDEYVLTFDEQGILRRWTHRSQFNGGDPMPSDCVSDEAKSAP